MSEIVQWLKTGKRGARAEFTDSDLLTALILINEEPMGRYKLQQMIGLTDSSTKSLLNYCKKKNLLEISSIRTGHFLTSQGKELVALVTSIFPFHDILNYKIFPDLNHYLLLISNEITNKEFKRVEIPSWKFRDISISYGAEAILLLKIDENEKLNFTEKDMDLKTYFPKLEQYIFREIKVVIPSNCLILITAAKTTELARKSAFITAMHAFDGLVKHIYSLI
ncbi:MAG: hypothetical protein JXA54_16030 [Candidatus Heimdallarchaeota archaeon]|nr:hypothetical protein [Candidatus Heimdallarchaeota archaeon]